MYKGNVTKQDAAVESISFFLVCAFYVPFSNSVRHFQLILTTLCPKGDFKICVQVGSAVVMKEMSPAVPAGCDLDIRKWS